MSNLFSKFLPKVYAVVKTIRHDGSDRRIFFNPNHQTVGELIGDEWEICDVFHLLQEDDCWLWKDVFNVEPDQLVTEEELEKWPELRHFITRDQHKELGTPERSRTMEQFKAMQETVNKGICPFCQPEQWKNPAIREGKYWILKRNDFPYKHTLHHFVVVLKEHGNENDIAPVNSEAWAEFGEIVQWAIKEFQLPGGGIVMRFGHPDYNASTIRHLHAHIQVPDLTGNVKATFAKDRSPEAEERRKSRLKGS